MVPDYEIFDAVRQGVETYNELDMSPDELYEVALQVEDPQDSVDQGYNFLRQTVNEIASYGSDFWDEFGDEVTQWGIGTGSATGIYKALGGRSIDNWDSVKLATGTTVGHDAVQVLQGSDWPDFMYDDPVILGTAALAVIGTQALYDKARDEL